MKSDHKPYTDTVISPNEIIRVFSCNTNPDDLKWHRDAEDRFVVIMDDGGWYFQMENCLPFCLSTKKCLNIPKMEWHRVIKGHQDLVLKIYKR